MMTLATDVCCMFENVQRATNESDVIDDSYRSNSTKCLTINFV